MSWDVRLVKSGESDIVASNVVRVSENEITCDFNLSGAVSGLWDIVVTNDEGRSDTLVGGFEVEEVLGPFISNVTPNIGGVNKLITINGVNFGAAVSKSKIVFVNGIEEIMVPDDDIYSWSDSQIKCYVPEQANDLVGWDVKIYVVDNA